MVIALVMTRSRMGNAAFFTSMLIAGVSGWPVQHATRSTVILLVSLIIIDVFVVGTWFGVENVIKRYEQTTIYRDCSQPAARWKNGFEPGLYAMDMLKDYPLTGSGGGTFYAAFPKYRPGVISAYFDYAHNDYVQFATDTGVIGLGLLGLDPARRLGADLDDGPHLGLDDPGLHQDPADAAFFDGSGVQDLGGRLDQEDSPDHNGRQQKHDGDNGKEDDFFLRRERFDRCEIHGQCIRPSRFLSGPSGASSSRGCAVHPEGIRGDQCRRPFPKEPLRGKG